MFRTARTLNVYIILFFTNKIKSLPVIEANRMIAHLRVQSLEFRVKSSELRGKEALLLI